MPADRASLVACEHLPRPDQHTSALLQHPSSVAAVRTAAFIVRAPLPPALLALWRQRARQDPPLAARPRTIGFGPIPSATAVGRGGRRPRPDQAPRRVTAVASPRSSQPFCGRGAGRE